MSVVLVMLTIDSLAVISPGGVNVPLYTVINQHIDYKFDAKRGAASGHARRHVERGAGRKITVRIIGRARQWAPPSLPLPG